jgi:hypothetical protein
MIVITINYNLWLCKWNLRFIGFWPLCWVRGVAAAVMVLLLWFYACSRSLFCVGGCFAVVAFIWWGLFVLLCAFWLLWDFVPPCLFVLHISLPRHVLCLGLEAFNIFANSKKNKIIITINCPPDLYKRLQF